ncbi:Pectinesterase inhibitor [Corchorus capsularis]|uniref:Pectinesterase inhibitor n=1 Tax=Corchorus capsularis TaxID=210143 RepID=A0A1R3ITD8_COCAP|nr:Pectinesterase inhibitor [Corchorus capsularis]
MEAKSSSSLHSFQVFMISLSILLLIMSRSIPTISATPSKTNLTQIYKNFIKSSCNSTRYPKDCNKALSPYASAIKADWVKLCNTSLSLTLNAASNTSSSIDSVSKMKGLSPSEAGIIRECAENVGDAIDELTESLKAMAGGLQGGADRKSQMNNIRTWVSAALTDEYTCTDDFQGQKVRKAVRDTIRKSVLNLAKMTSNCLALFNFLYR